MVDTKLPSARVKKSKWMNAMEKEIKSIEQRLGFGGDAKREETSGQQVGVQAKGWS